jgi:hypothetical protein
VWLQNIDSRDLGWKISGMKVLQAMSGFGRQWFGSVSNCEF